MTREPCSTSILVLICWSRVVFVRNYRGRRTNILISLGVECELFDTKRFLRIKSYKKWSYFATKLLIFGINKFFGRATNRITKFHIKMNKFHKKRSNFTEEWSNRWCMTLAWSKDPYFPTIIFRRRLNFLAKLIKKMNTNRLINIHHWIKIQMSFSIDQLKLANEKSSTKTNFSEWTLTSKNCFKYLFCCCLNRCNDENKKWNDITAQRRDRMNFKILENIQILSKRTFQILNVCCLSHSMFIIFSGGKMNNVKLFIRWYHI